MNELLQEYRSAVTLHSENDVQATEMTVKAEAAGVRFFRDYMISLEGDREFKVSEGFTGKGCTVKVFWPTVERKEDNAKSI